MGREKWRGAIEEEKSESRETEPIKRPMPTTRILIAPVSRSNPPSLPMDHATTRREGVIVWLKARSDWSRMTNERPRKPTWRRRRKLRLSKGWWTTVHGARQEVVAEHTSFIYIPGWPSLTDSEVKRKVVMVVERRRDVGETCWQRAKRRSNGWPGK
jgi:hypothetical protein